jgi:hypothetical protein
MTFMPAISTCHLRGRPFVTDQREQSERLSKREIALAMAVVGLPAIVFFPTLGWLVASWSGNPYYSHGFLVPLISAYFAWRRRDVLQQRKPSNVGLVVLAVGVTMHLLAVPWQAYLVSAANSFQRFYRGVGSDQKNKTPGVHLKTSGVWSNYLWGKGVL